MSAKLILVLGVVIFLVGGFFLLNKKMSKKEKLLKETGVMTKALVSKVYIPATKGRKLVNIHYKFNDKFGNEHEGRMLNWYVGLKSKYEAIKEGDVISIKYLPDEPKFNRTVEELENKK